MCIKNDIKYVPTLCLICIICCAKNVYAHVLISLGMLVSIITCIIMNNLHINNNTYDHEVSKISFSMRIHNLVSK